MGKDVKNGGRKQGNKAERRRRKQERERERREGVRYGERCEEGRANKKLVSGAQKNNTLGDEKRRAL